MVFKRFLPVLFFMSISALSGTSQQLQPDKKLIKGTLQNGLTYYIYPNAFPKGEAVYRLFLKTGSLVESDNQRGLAHFLEHMAFNGTAHFPNDSVVRFLEKNGAKFGKDLNAHTSYNETVFKLQLPTTDPRFVENTITILSDWAGRMTLDSVEIEKERGVVLSEWLSSQKGGQPVEEIFLSELLHGSRFADRKVIGDTAVIKHFNHLELRKYYQNWYDPSLMAVAIVGDVDPAKIKGLIESKFDNLATRGPITLPEFTINPYSNVEVKTALQPSEKNIELNIIQLHTISKPVQSREDYSGSLEQIFLNQLLKNRFRALSYEQPSYAKASMQFSGFLRTTTTFFANVVLPPTRVDSAITDFVFHLQQINRYGFDSYEIQQVKEEYHRMFKRRAQPQQSISSTFIMDEIYDDFYRSQPVLSSETALNLFEEYVQKVDSVTLVHRLQTQLKSTASHYLITGNEQPANFLPTSKKLLEMMSGKDLATIPRYYKPVSSVNYLLQDEPEGGVIVERTSLDKIGASSIRLSNGVTVIFRPSEQGDNKITLTGFRKGGRYSFAPEDYITSEFSTNVIALSGAGNHSREELSQYLKGNSSSVRFLIDKLRTGIAGSADANDAETLFQLIYLKWTAPKADEEAFSLLKKRTIENLVSAKKTTGAQFEEDLSYLINGKDYTTRASDAKLVQEKLKFDRILPVFGQAFGNADGFTFIIISDDQIEKLEDLAIRYLGSLPSGKVDTENRYIRPKTLTHTSNFERHDGTSPKAIVSLIYQKDSSPADYNMFQLKSDILGAVIKMKLLKQLREEMGMVYSVGVSSSSTPYPSGLVRQIISFSADPANVTTLVGQVKEQLQNLADHPNGFSKELEDVKMNILKDMRLKIQKDVFWSGFIRNSIFYNDTDWDYITHFEDRVLQISATDLVELLKEYYINSPSLFATQYPKNTGFDSKDYTNKSTKNSNYKKMKNLFRNSCYLLVLFAATMLVSSCKKSNRPLSS